MPKKIVVFSDGTGQEGGKGQNTNVYKLFNMIEDRTHRQIAFYDRGLGTGWRKITGKAFGIGISKNIKDCYRFIFDNYCAEDEIFLFGFSRGATTVRSLSGFIHLFGVLPKSRPELIRKAYRIYKKNNKEKREKLAEDFIKRHHTQWCKIKFLGVWDTVAALGIPIKALDLLIDQIPFFRHKFHDLRLSESVEHGRHALAIDDERLVFHPTLWDKELYEGQTVKQVWFCGMHTDVGGGYREQQLSDIALIWMLTEAKEKGLLIFPRHNVHINPDANGMMHNSRGKWYTKLYRKKQRSWDTERRGKPVVHESVFMRRINQNNTDQPPYEPWIMAKNTVREPWPENLQKTGHFT